MANVMLIFVLAVFGSSAALDVCDYKPSWSDRQQQMFCSYGCCEYLTSDPCCDDPIYVNGGFIAGVALGSIVLVVSIILLICRRRRLMATTIRYGSPAPTTSVITTTTQSGQMQQPGGYGYAAPVAPPAYGAPQYGPPPAYNNQGFTQSNTSVTNIKAY